MKIIGRGGNGSFLCEMSRDEAQALTAPYWGRDYDEDLRVGEDYDVLNRLKQTLEFERDRKTIPHMAAQIRDAAEKLEKAFA